MDYKLASQKEETDSSSFEEGTSAGDDGDFYQPPTRKCMSPSTSAAMVLAVSISTLISVLLTLALLAVWMSRPLTCAVPDDGRNVTTHYGSNYSYMSLDPKYDSLWDSYLVDTFGTVYVPEALKVTDAFYAMSMFHQIHCLASLRRALQRQRGGEDVGVDWHDDDHWPHCMDYLLQTFLCMGDDTKERIETGFPILTISGAFDVRQCRDWSKLTDLACVEQERALENGWREGEMPSICT